MALDLRFPNPVESSGAEVFGMKGARRLTEDIEAQRQAMIDYLDCLNYMNGNSFDDPLQTRHAIAYMAAAMPSLAYVNPHKTREMVYNLSLVVDNIMSNHLLMRMAPFNSDHVLLVEAGLAAALYRLVGGRPAHDDFFHEAADGIFDLIKANERQQHVAGVDTTRGRFEVMPNAMALLVLNIHDRVFGTRYAAVEDDVLTSLVEKLWDPKSGLFFESFQTGSIGYANESVNPRSSWHTSVLRPNVNGLAIAFMNIFDPTGCAHAWERYKELFLPSLLEISAEAVAFGVGSSFTTQLGPGSEDVLAAMLAAREMQDLETFDALQAHLFDIGKPHLWEGHLFFTEFGEQEHMIGHFALFARAHAGWGKLLSHPWEDYYDYDFNEVR